jgi:hypothetical protein
MKTSAKMVMMSHLSDAQFEYTIGFADPKDTQESRDKANLRLNFVKYMIDKLLDDRLDNLGQPLTNHLEVDPDEMFKEFLELKIND